MQPEMTRDEASEILLRHGIPHMAVFGSADLVNLCGSVVARRLAALEAVVGAADSFLRIERQDGKKGVRRGTPLSNARAILAGALAALDGKEGA